jgi:mono/diheme cytochrome c family protein
MKTMAKFWLGGLVSLFLVAVVATVLLSSGRAINVAATAPPDWVDRLAPQVLEAAVKRESKALQVTIPTDPAAMERGFSHYRENCLPCHGAPGGKRTEFAQGLNPQPPELDSPAVKAASDAELFWITKNGIRMTGMPAFGVNHSDDEIRDILAFVRKLPSLDASYKERLKPSVEEDHHHAGGHHH